jgi:hypothetical protein
MAVDPDTAHDQLVHLAESLRRPGSSFERDLATARAARPDLAVAEMSDRPTGRPSGAAPAASRPGACAQLGEPAYNAGHQRVMDAAVRLRGTPAGAHMSVEATYAAVLRDDPALQRVVKDSTPGTPTFPVTLSERTRAAGFGDKIGRVAFAERDAESNATPAEWARRGREIVAEHRVAGDFAMTAEQGYALAFAESVKRQAQR